MRAMSLGLLVALLGSGTVVAQTVAPISSRSAAPAAVPSFTPPPGSTHQGAFAIRGRLVPLPPGAWVAFSRHAWQGNPRDANFTYEHVGLARVTATGVDALILVSTTDIDQGTAFIQSWGRDQACNRTNTHFMQAVTRDDRDQACMMLNHVQRGGASGSSPVWADYAALRQGRTDQFPDTLLAATYRVARNTGATTVTYYVGMEGHGFPAQPRISWANSAWHPDRADASRLAMVARYREWMTANFEPVRQGVEQGRQVVLSPLP